MQVPPPNSVLTVGLSSPSHRACGGLGDNIGRVRRGPCIYDLEDGDTRRLQEAPEHPCDKTFVAVGGTDSDKVRREDPPVSGSPGTKTSRVPGDRSLDGVGVFGRDKGSHGGRRRQSRRSQNVFCVKLLDSSVLRKRGVTPQGVKTVVSATRDVVLRTVGQPMTGSSP